MRPGSPFEAVPSTRADLFDLSDLDLDLDAEAKRPFRSRAVRGAATVVVLLVAGFAAALAFATAPPVGPLPAGPTTTVTVGVGRTFTVTLPTPRIEGRVWRVARPYDGKVVRQVGEGDSARGVWLSYRGRTAGNTRVVFALTRGETRKAYAARTFVIRVLNRVG
jgi:hypothetical protein